MATETRRITYYAIARNERDEIEQLFVVRENGKQVSQTWTGVIYPSDRAGLADVGRLNGCAA